MFNFLGQPRDRTPTDELVRYINEGGSPIQWFESSAGILVDNRSLSVASGKTYEICVAYRYEKGLESFLMATVAGWRSDKLFVGSKYQHCPLKLGLRHERGIDYLAIESYQRKMRLTDKDFLQLSIRGAHIHIPVVSNGSYSYSGRDGAKTETLIPLTEYVLDSLSQSPIEALSYISANKRNDTVFMDLPPSVRSDIQEMSSSYAKFRNEVLPKLQFIDNFGVKWNNGNSDDSYAWW